MTRNERLKQIAGIALETDAAYWHRLTHWYVGSVCQISTAKWIWDKGSTSFIPLRVNVVLPHILFAVKKSNTLPCKHELVSQP